MLTGGFAPLSRREEGREGAEPLLRTAREVTRGQRVCQDLQACRITAGQEGVATLPECDALVTQTIRKPGMLIEAHTGREGEVGADADKQPAPLAVEQVEVVLHHPPARVLEMPTITLADGGQDTGGFTGLENHDDLIGGGPTKVARDKVVAPLIGGRFHEGRAPVLRPHRDPAVVLAGHVAMIVRAIRSRITVRRAERAKTNNQN